DLGAGVRFEKGLRTCVVASAFASALELDLAERRPIFHAALLRSIGCTASAPELAVMFGDEVQFQRALKELDPADPATFKARFGDWSPGRQHELQARLAEILPNEGPTAIRSACEVSAALGHRLGVEEAAIVALDDAYERWDGNG